MPLARPVVLRWGCDPEAIGMSMISSSGRRRRLARTLPAVAVFVALSAGASDERVAPQIAETQLTLRLDPLQGQATAISISKRTLTVLTAAHLLSAADVGRAILIRRPEGELKGRLSAVTPNPGFPRSRRGKPSETPAGEAVGVDSAIASIRVDPPGERGRRVLGVIRPAELASRLI